MFRSYCELMLEMFQLIFVKLNNCFESNCLCSLLLHHVPVETFLF